MPAALLTHEQIWDGVRLYVKRGQVLDAALAKDISRTPEALTVALELSEIQGWVRAFDWKLILAQAPLRERIYTRFVNHHRLPWDLITAAKMQLGIE